MQTEAVGSSELAVVAGDVLALRGAGLAAPETWALLCQAAQALQDLFLSNGGVVGGSGVGPVVTPHTLELTPRGRVTLRLASPETARAYLPPEYRPGRVYSDTDSEKMWMYSLGRALLDTTPRIAALTGSVSVSPSSALQSVLSAMTEPDPHRRASLMNLLDVISEYCRTRLQSKPFTHIVMDMYREVIRSPQYSARKRAAFSGLRYPLAGTQRAHQRQNQQQTQSLLQNQEQQHQKPSQQHQHTGHYSKHQAKGALFKAQSRNSRSHPNLLSLSGHEPTLDSSKPQFQSQIDIKTSMPQRPVIQHTRTNSQPEYSERVQQGFAGHTRSTHNLMMFSNGQTTRQTAQTNNLYSDPIYALPVKPFLSSQDVRVNGFLAKPNLMREDVYGQTVTGRPRTIKNGGMSQPNIAHLARNSNGDRPLGFIDDIKGKGSIGRNTHTAVAQLLHRQHSNPQLPTRNLQEHPNALRAFSQSNGTTVPQKLRVFDSDNKIDVGLKNSAQNNLVSSMKVPSLHGPVPPKPPRVMTGLKRPAAPLPEPNKGLSESVAPAKPPRLAIKNGPRARRGKPVQRAPSRLYRTIGGPTRCFNKNQCVGPEFVVRANQPPKILCVGDIKTNSTGRIVVILLTGQRIEVSCDPQKITAGELFQAIVQAEGLDENFTLGLAALLAGDFAMLPPETKLSKVAPPGWLNSNKNKGTLGLPTSFMLYLRLRFFLPSLRGMRSWISKHLLYLQIRRCILEQQLVCPLAQLINLTGFALQAEFGNYNVNEHGRGDYFLLEHYIPESLILNPDLQLQSPQLPGGAEALRARLHQAHRDRRGLDASKAEEMFITHAQTLPDYGSHYYIAIAETKELEKIIERVKKSNGSCSATAANDRGSYACPENIYQLETSSECPIYGKIEFDRGNSCNNVQGSIYSEQQKINVPTKCNSSNNEEIYAIPKSTSVAKLVETNNNSSSKQNKSKKSDSNVWLAVHAQGLKLFERGGRPRERNELVSLQWRDIQTLSYSKNSLVVYTRFNGKRCKFKLRMDHKKSYYAFKLTSLHHQFFLKLRSELTSFHGLAKDFGIPLMVEPVPPPSKLAPDSSKPKITIVSNGKNVTNSKFPMQLEEYQNKENENPQKVINPVRKSEDMDTEPVCYTPEEDALYAQVNARLEPEGASRDTEDESDRALASRNCHVAEILKPQRTAEEDKLYSYPSHGLPCENESLYATPKSKVSNTTDRTEGGLEHPEELYAAISKPGHKKKNIEYPVPDEVWDVASSKKNLHEVKTSSLPNYGTPRHNTGFRTPSLPRRLGVKMGTRAIYSSVVQRDSDLTDDHESLSVKSDTASSIQSASAQSNDSPMPEAYVLNADIRTDDETFRVGNDETMSASLAARLEELSFAEERILHTIQLERGHGGSIGLQVTEGNDGGVYVQAVSVGGSADMAGNVNKGDKIVAINGQSLLNLRYEEALKMLQSSSETVELVLSQITSNRNNNLRRAHAQESTETNYLQNLRFETSSEAETSSMTTKWLSQRATDVASVQNTSSAYSSAASSSMGNHNTNNIYLTDVADTNALNSASILLSLSDFDVSLEIAVPPPVPPRRRKRKTDIPHPSKPTAGPRTIVEEVKPSVRNRNSRSERKPRSLPPPPPTSRNIPPRERKPRTTGNGHLPSTAADNLQSTSLKLDSKEVSLESKSEAVEFVAVRTSPRFVITKVTDVEEQAITPKTDSQNELCNDRSNGNLDYRNENLSGRSSPMPRHYSPLFFTMRDFESVMTYSAKSDKSLSEQFDSIVTRDESSPTLITSFIENETFDDCDEEGSEEEVCFRVTTTNVPFEKCLGDWKMDYESSDFSGKFDHVEDHYVFEDYMDRRKKPNIQSATAPFLFDDDTFENVDVDKPTNLRSATKVRFVIESPTLSSPDTDFSNTIESLSNCEPLMAHLDNLPKTSVIITEIAETSQDIKNNDVTKTSSNSDEFGDVPFCALIESEFETNNDIGIRVKNDSEGNSKITGDSPTEGAIELRETENSEKCSRPRSTPSPRFVSPKKREFIPISNIEEILMPELPPTYDPREEGFVKKQWDATIRSAPEAFDDDGMTSSQSACDTPSANTGRSNAREAFVSGKLNMDSRDKREMNSPISDDSWDDKVGTEKSGFEKKNIFIDAALRDFIDDDADDMDWRDSSSEEDERKERDMSHDSTDPSNLHDIREIGESAVSEMLNRVTCHGQEVSLDKHPRPPPAMSHDDNEVDEENGAEEQRVKTMGTSRRLYFGDISRLSCDSRDDTTSESVTIRRNSFLENMLTDDDVYGSPETNVPCSVIAAHPKPLPSSTEPFSLPKCNVPVETIETSPNDLGNFVEHGESGQQGIADDQTSQTWAKRLDAGTRERNFGPMPKVLEPIVFGSTAERRKSTGEAKNDVLSELLSNFSAIKLKCVEPRTHEWTPDQIDDKVMNGTEIMHGDAMGTAEMIGEINFEATPGMKVICAETKAKDAETEKIDSNSDRSEKFPKTEVKTSEKMKIPDLVRPSSLDIAVCVSEKTDKPNIRRRRDVKSATEVIRCLEDEGIPHNLENFVNGKNLDNHLGRILDNRDTTISVDKCAIDRNTNNQQIQCNNNDNKAMTPVDLSNDQKPRDAEVSAIIPGSVRSFVELYEIQSEKTSDHSKSNFSIPVAKTRLRMRYFEGLWNNVDCDTTDTKQSDGEIMGVETRFTGVMKDQEFNALGIRDGRRIDESNGCQDSTIEMKNGGFKKYEIFSKDDRRYENESSSYRMPVAAKRRTQESCLKIANELSPRSDSKKTVTFHNDCSVMKLGNSAPRKIPIVDTSIESSNEKPKTPKRRAPERPVKESRVTEELDCATRSIVKSSRELNSSDTKVIRQCEEVNPTPLPRSVSFDPTQINLAEEKDEEDRSKKSGIAPTSNPKADVPQIQQPYVFYCRV